MAMAAWIWRYLKKAIPATIRATLKSIINIRFHIIKKGNRKPRVLILFGLITGARLFAPTQ